MSNVYTIKTLSALIIATVTLLTLSVSAQSQSQSQAENLQDAAIDSLELSSVVVTASKMPQTRRETTKPIQIIDRAEIEKNAGRDLSQILNQQSGIRVNDSFGAPSNGRILYLQGAAATNTLILVDGLAINDPSGTGGLFDLRLLSTENIERIEILKGSQSTLYGTDAIAGVINIITRKSGENAVNGNVKASYGSFDTFNGSAGVNGTLHEALQYNITYNRESSDGISAAENPGDSGSFGDDGFQMDSFSGRFDITPLANLTVSPTFRYSDYSGDYDGGAFIDAENEFSLNMLRSALQVEYGSDSFRLNGDYSFTSTDRSFTTSFGENAFEGRFHNADLYGSYTVINYVRLLAGLNFQDYIIPSTEEQTVDGERNMVTVGIPKKDAQIYSPYATLYLENWSGLSAELGYRLNSHSEYGQNSTFSFAPSYRLNDQVKLFASISTGFKAPTLDELFGQFGANPDLDPQKSLYANIGAEVYLMDQALKLSGQYFNREIDDLIIYASNGFINRDRQNDQGVELSADWFVSNSLTVGGWYNYLDGEITTMGSNGDVTEDNLIRRPTHSVGFRAGVQPLEGLSIRLNGEYSGERSDIFFNPANNFLAEDVTLDPYLLVNLYAEYSFLDRQVTAFADIKNLLDSDFTEVYGYNSMGTSLQAGLKLAF
jgi:vitamin B12 transporter